MEKSIEIKNRFDGSVIFTYESDAPTMRDAVLAALASGANLYGADLSGADLSGADLSDATRIPMFCKWRHGVTGDKVQIGCEARTVAEWEAFFASDEVLSTPRGTSDFAQIHAVFEAYKAYLATLKTYEDAKQS